MADFQRIKDVEDAVKNIFDGLTSYEQAVVFKYARACGWDSDKARKESEPGKLPANPASLQKPAAAPFPTWFGGVQP